MNLSKRKEEYTMPDYLKWQTHQQLFDLTKNAITIH